MHAAGGNHIESADISQLAGGRDVQPAPQTVPADIGKDDDAQAEGPYLKREVGRGDVAAFLPTAHTHESIAGIDANRNLSRPKFFQRFLNNVRLFNRDRS